MGVVEAGSVDQSVVTVADDMFPREYWAVVNRPNTIYFDTFREPGSPAIPQGDEDTEVDLSACAGDGWKSVAVPAGIGRLMKLHCINPIPTGGAFKILIAGDSLTAAHAILLDEQNQAFFNYTITYLGSTAGTPPVRHEGVGGQTWQRHVTGIPVDSAFVFDGKLNIPLYFQTFGTPDLVALIGGTNDVSLLDSEAPGFSDPDGPLDTALGYLRQLVDAFLVADPNLRIAIASPPTPNPNANAYVAVATDFATWRKTHRAYVEETIRRFDRNHPRVNVVGSYLHFDRDDLGSWGVDDYAHPESGGYREMVQGWLLGWAFTHFPP